MARHAFADSAIPSFGQAPSVVLIVGDVEFFVEEAAAKALAKLAENGAEVLRFEDDAPADSVSEALWNRSLFSLQRVVWLDISRLLGSESPGRLLAQAAEAWREATAAGRRKAFKFARALLSALDLDAGGPPEELAETAARRVRKKEDVGALAEILRELPEEGGSPASLTASLRRLLERGNDGLVALVTAVNPPAGVDLVKEIEKKGLLLLAEVREDSGAALARLARARAKVRDVTIDADAIERLRVQTDGSPALFAAELEKLLEWAGVGGQVRAADVRRNVEDEASEDVYPFYEAIGRRDAGEALARLERLFSGRAVRAGKRDLDTDAGWPTMFLGMLAAEVRRMLLIRSVLDERGGFDSGMPYPAFAARIVPRLQEPVAPFGASPFAAQNGAVSGYVWYMAAQRASRYTSAELARALARAAEVDVKLKSSSPELAVLSQFVAELIAGL